MLYWKHIGFKHCIWNCFRFIYFFLCVYVCESHVGMADADGGVQMCYFRSLGTGVKDVCEPLFGC